MIDVEYLPHWLYIAFSCSRRLRCGRDSPPIDARECCTLGHARGISQWDLGGDVGNERGTIVAAVAVFAARRSTAREPIG